MINTNHGTVSYADNVPALPSGSLVAYTIPNANISVIKPGDYSVTVTAINCAGRQPTLQIVQCMGLCTIVYLHTIPMFLREYLPDHAITVIDPSGRLYVGGPSGRLHVGVHQLSCM